MVNIYGPARKMDLNYASNDTRAALNPPHDNAEELAQAHEGGRMEVLAQALAVIGHIEGGFRVDADGDHSHPSFRLADLLREVALAVRREVGDPTTRSTLEIVARADEANELSQYVLEVSEAYAAARADVAEVLSNVAGDIRKGTDGVGRLRMASDINTDPDVLTELVADADHDVRWWAAQNPSTPGSALSSVLATELQPMVIVAMIQNSHLPDEDVERFASHSSPDVGRAAKKRLGLS